MAKGKVKWHEKDGPAENARLRLPGIAKGYFEEVRRTLAENPAPPELHKLRLASKHFRYTLELFRPCYAAGLEERIKSLKEVQDLLGECNDAVASLPSVEKALGRRRAEKLRMRSYLEQLAAEKAGAFRKHWTEVFDAPGREDWWTGYLKRSARPPVKGGRGSGTSK
jgi:CHAD domain-containing protein